MITLRSLPFITTCALLLPLGACADDDSSTTTEGSSSTTIDPPDSDPGSTTAMGSTTAVDTGTDSTVTGPDPDTGSDTGATSTSGTDGGTTSDTTTGAAGLEIAGAWLEEFSPGMGITHAIAETQWEQLAEFGDALFHVSEYDNAAGIVVAQGDAANEFFPGLYSRFDWTWDGADLHYCTAVYDAATAAAALAAPASDPDDLETGCGGFPWSRLVPVR